MTWSEVKAKYRRLGRHVASDERLERVIDEVRDLERGRVTGLVRALREVPEHIFQQV